MNKEANPRVSPVLTVGYGGAERSIDQFMTILKRWNVQCVVDVRSQPYSRYRSEFSRESLASMVVDAGLSYMFMGQSLGGRPSDLSCYTNGKVDYDKCRTKAWFQQGLDRIEADWRNGRHLALMCAELLPERCHRSRLIGEALAARDIPVGHIDELGEVMTHAAVMDRISGGQQLLFDTGLRSRKKYK